MCTSSACNRELVVGLLAHELAHHVHGDAFASPWGKWSIELRADRFAGTAAPVRPTPWAVTRIAGTVILVS